MSYKKFDNGDLFYNTIKAKPRFEFKISNGKALINSGGGEAVLHDLLIAQPLAAGCPNPNSFDFSCEENSFNIATI